MWTSAVSSIFNFFFKKIKKNEQYSLLCVYTKQNTMFCCTLSLCCAAAPPAALSAAVWEQRTGKYYTYHIIIWCIQNKYSRVLWYQAVLCCGSTLHILLRLKKGNKCTLWVCRTKVLSQSRILYTSVIIICKLRPYHTTLCTGYAKDNPRTRSFIVHMLYSRYVFIF